MAQEERRHTHSLAHQGPSVINNCHSKLFAACFALLITCAPLECAEETLFHFLLLSLRRYRYTAPQMKYSQCCYPSLARQNNLCQEGARQIPVTNQLQIFCKSVDLLCHLVVTPGLGFNSHAGGTPAHQILGCNICVCGRAQQPGSLLILPGYS